MSSFIISKYEYVKAAGAVAGIVETYNRGNEEMYIWDHWNSRKMEGRDFYDRFVECFEMNAMSVYEQYSHIPGEELYTDGNEYSDVFTEYLKIGQQASHDVNKLRSLVYHLRDFFRSAEYQIENQAYYFKTKMFFDSLLERLMGPLYPHECECWGDFNPGI